MAFSHGRNAVFKLDNAAGTLTDISAYITDADMSRVVDLAETTTFGDASDEYVVGIKRATFSLSGNFDPTVDAILYDAANGPSSSKTFEFYPHGTTTGNPYYTGECYGTDYNPAGSIGDVAKFTFSARVTGGVTRSTAA